MIRRRVQLVDAELNGRQAQPFDRGMDDVGDGCVAVCVEHQNPQCGHVEPSFPLPGNSPRATRDAGSTPSPSAGSAIAARLPRRPNGQSAR